MTDPENAQDRVQSTEQIAAAGSVGSDDRTSPGQHPLADVQTEPPISATQAAGSDLGAGGQAAAGSDLGAGGQPHAQLLEEGELQNILVRWKDIQAGFVDEPRQAVQDADALVADLMQRLARMFAGEREQLESRWSSGDDVSTEELRHGLRRYRSFFERLLAA